MPDLGGQENLLVGNAAFGNGGAYFFLVEIGLSRNSLTCLKNCNLSLAEMKDYIALCLQGQSAIPKRKAFLAGKRTELLASLEATRDAIDYIDWKQGFYDDVLSGKTPYVSNLTAVNED